METAKLNNFVSKISKMKKNMGNTDRILRILIAAIVVALFLDNIVTGALAVTLLVLAGIFLVTSAIGFCPLYTLLGVSTCRKKA